MLRYHGDAAWRQVQGALTVEERSAVEGPILANAWYPLDLCSRLERAIVDACADGDERICIDVGSYTAAVNLASLYRTYQAGGEDPSSFYKKLERLHPKLYDFGSMSVVEPMGRKEVHLLHDFEGFATRTNCLASIGFFRGAGISVAIPGLVVEEVSCQARGNANCLFVARWGGPTIRRRG